MPLWRRSPLGECVVLGLAGPTAMPPRHTSGPAKARSRLHVGCDLGVGGPGRRPRERGKWRLNPRCRRGPPMYNESSRGWPVGCLWSPLRPPLRPLDRSGARVLVVKQDVIGDQRFLPSGHWLGCTGPAPPARHRFVPTAPGPASGLRPPLARALWVPAAARYLRSEIAR